MTGYGRGESVMHGRKVVVEIKSVNHRYNDITVKLPRILNAYEDEVRKRLSERVSRGKTDVYINVESLTAADFNIALNEPLADAYVEKLRYIREKYNTADDVSLSLIARFPDVVTAEKVHDDAQAAREIYETMLAALDDAASAFISMREREGSALKRDILLKNDELKELAASVAEKAPAVAAEYRERLAQRMREVLADVNIDESRILTEAALFADRSCVDEELTRLSSHLAQLPEILESGGSAGKKLDFLIQEINREINTIGSKSNDAEITRLVIELKSETEKIREQVQNVE